ATTAPGNDGKTGAPPPGKVELRVVESCPRRWRSGGDGGLVAMTRLGPRGSPDRGGRVQAGGSVSRGTSCPSGRCCRHSAGWVLWQPGLRGGRRSGPVQCRCPQRSAADGDQRVL